jgi:hypothetical protein
MSDRASKALAEASLPGEPRTYDAASKRSGVPLSTLYHRNHGRPSRERKAQDQQYLTPPEEEALEKYLISRAVESKLTSLEVSTEVAAKLDVLEAQAAKADAMLMAPATMPNGSAIVKRNYNARDTLEVDGECRWAVLTTTSAAALSH